MPETPNYAWPPMDSRRVLGKRISRLDGVAKSSGHARYAYDVRRPGLLHAALLTCPHAHARIKSIDVSAAEKSPGFAAVTLMAQPGEEIQYAGYEIAALAADTLDHARDAVRRIKVDYEVLPHFVKEQDLQKAGPNAKPFGEQVAGDPAKAFQDAAVVSEGFYGIPVLNHCCLETHGQVIEWKGEHLEYWPSTQSVSNIGPELARDLKIPATNVHTHMDYMGGGFGSKFTFDRWGSACARLSQAAGGRAVKLFLDRVSDQEIAGSRPAYYANIRTGANKEGLMTVWDAETWGTGGVGGVTLAPNALPYIFRGVPNKRMRHTSVSINAAQQRAWRAPNNPQYSYLTCAAMEDLAAKLDMDPVEFFDKNLEYASGPPGAAVYRAQLHKAAELAEWKKLWRPRGRNGSGAIKRGLGIGFNMWGGMGHASSCRTRIHPDGSIEVELGSQDLGTGTRTVIAMVAAETFGVPVEAVRVNIGDSSYPVSGASGGSTTVGGVSASTRKAGVNARAKLFEAVAPSLGAQPDQLEAVDGQIRVQGGGKSLPWKAACQKLGTRIIDEVVDSNPRNSAGLMAAGAGGCQIADVSVDTETGLVRMNRMVAVQDCGLVVNPKTAESQVYGAMILSVNGALFEERVMDAATGRILNPDLEFYKLAGAGDVPELIVHMNIEPEHDQRGVIGLGEPPVVGGIAAIANAVANAIGVRVPVVPLTPGKVLAALEGRKA